MKSEWKHAIIQQSRPDSIQTRYSWKQRSYNHSEGAEWGGGAEAEAHMLLLNASHFPFPENTNNFTPLKLLRFNKAGNINAMLLVRDAVPLYFEITWANHRAPGRSQRANLYT